MEEAEEREREVKRWGFDVSPDDSLLTTGHSM